MMLKHSIRSLRVSLAAFGLLMMIPAPPAFAQSADHDPLGRPIWQDAAQQTAVLDSLPTRLRRFQMLSFPLVPTSNTISSIFEELGGYNPSVWRLGHWLPSLAGPNKYQEPNAFTTIEPGLGYWLITRDSTTVRFNGTAAPSDTIELPLLQGPNGVAEWNQLGNPFNFNSPVANWRVVKRDSLLTLGQAASANWIDANMRTWDPNTRTYTASGNIPRGRGFFTRLIDPDTSRQWTRWGAFDTTGASAGYWSSVRVDSKGIPHISFFTALGFPNQLRYLTRKGNAWQSKVVDITSGNENGVFSSIEVDSLDQPYIAHQVWGPGGGGGHRPFFTRRLSNGSWTPSEQIDPVAGTPTSGWGIKIKLFHGGPRVAYSDNTAGVQTLKYAEKTISGWAVEPVSALGGVPDQVQHDLGFDISRVGVPHLAAVSRNAPFGLRYFTKSGGTWTSELVDSAAASNRGLSPSLILDSNSVPHISYFDATLEDLKYARKTGASWSVETVDATGNTGNFSEIMIGSNGQPAIAYLEYGSMGLPNRIRYAQRSAGGSWQIETVDDVGVSSSQAYLGATLDAQGNPRITYQAFVGSLRLRYAEKIRGGWRIKVPPVVGPEPPIATLAKPAGAEWAVAITPWQGERSAEPLMLGAAQLGTELSAIKSAAAPAPPGEHVLSLAVAASDGDYVRDFQPSASTLRWSFQTAGGETPGEQTLDFMGLDLPKGMRLFLSDPESGWTREVSDGQRISIAARPRTLEFTASLDGTIDTRVPADRLAFAYPNPFTASTGLAFTLARPSEIRIDIVDITGRRVRTLTRNATSAGEHVLVWDGRDDAGRAAPSGVYLANYRVGEARGSRRLVRVE